MEQTKINALTWSRLWYTCSRSVADTAVYALEQAVVNRFQLFFLDLKAEEPVRRLVQLSERILELLHTSTVLSILPNDN